MSYGVEVYNSNAQLQFGTNASEGFTVVATGTLANLATLTYNTYNDILLARRSTTGYLLGTTTPGTSGSWINRSGVTVDYIRMQRIPTTTENDTGSYGIQVFNSSGTLTYSSKFTRGQRLISVSPPGTYSSASNNTTAHPVIYTGALTGPDIYFGFGRMVFNLGPSTAQYYENAYFDYTNNLIRVRNMYTYLIPGFGDIIVPYANKSSLIIMTRN